MTDETKRPESRSPDRLSEGPVDATEQLIATAAPEGDGETVLIVEDDAGLRKLAVRTVSRLGYAPVAAEDGPAALALLDDGLEVDVLFTDVVLPRGMNGVALAEAARERQPGLRVLYTSGYTDDAIARNGVADDGIVLLNKPYRRESLAHRLRQVLDGA